jgi:hypothetical protein
MAEPVSMRDAAADEAEVARKNLRWAWALFGVFWLLFGGTVLVALVYLWLS